jgi:hypothetical protein
LELATQYPMHGNPKDQNQIGMLAVSQNCGLYAQLCQMTTRPIQVNLKETKIVSFLPPTVRLIGGVS